jgi:TRAP-type C4-dicarboxylate transport system permease small subunit
MAGSGAVLEDSSLLSKLDRMLLPLERFCALLSGLAIFSLMFLAAYSVTGRKFFASPMMGYVDYIEAAMPIIAIMGVSYVQRDGTHIRMDMLVSALKGRTLWLFELLSVLLMLLLIVFLMWGAWEHFLRSIRLNADNVWMDWVKAIVTLSPSEVFSSRDSSIDVGIPIAFGVLVLRLLLQAWGYGRALVLGLQDPVAVPLNLTVAEQAMAEARTLEDGN